ncbi:MAG TPA: carboxypeptidase-like regulatory domain-containing protein [Candidatus Polarisedimenticolaceae bacterium]|nr:carboxypeptidase-like regulatory domain-containing protein [Candidatus Polarisedimenticolaceae bacterium]
MNPSAKLDWVATPSRLPDRSRWLAALVSLSIFPLVAGPEVLGQDAPRPFAGFVSDAVGNVLQNVELLIVDTRRPAEPLASARSDERGRFRFAGVPRGVYRLAALKEGYLTFIARVDTDVENWHEIVLHPVSAADPDRREAVPDDSSWVYRLPRRYVLHDREPEPPRESLRAAPPASRPERREGWSVRLDRLVAVPADTTVDGTGGPEMRGSETGLEISSTVGARGRMAVRGFQREFASTRVDAAGPSAVTRDARSMQLSFAYETGPAAELAVSAFYAEREVAYAATPPETGAAIGLAGSTSDGHTHWGYDASWATRLDESSSLRLSVDYRDTTLNGVGVAGVGGIAADGAADGVSARTVGASGVYAHAPVDDHELRFDVRAQRLDTRNVAAAAGEPTVLTPVDFALAGWSVGLDAQDTWSVGPPLSLVYGLGYRQATGTRRAALFVPRVGAGWRFHGVRLDAMVSYHEVTDWTPRDAGRWSAPFRPAETWGYQAELRVPVGSGVSVTGATAFSPLQLDPLGYAGAGFETDTRPIYLTDGNTAAREDRLAIAQQSQRTRTYVEYARGSAAGQLAPITFDAVQTDFLIERTLDYGAGRFGLEVVPSGTGVVLQYQTLLCRSTSSGDGLDTREESIELRVTQQLADGLPVGDWRLLFAVRRSWLTSFGETDVAVARDPELLDTLNHRLTAGLSVSF